MRRCYGWVAGLALVVGACNTATPATTGAAPSTSMATTVSSSTTGPAATTTTPAVDELAGGLSCHDLAVFGLDYPDAVAYWEREGQPGRMDADRNGIPCEFIYGTADVVDFWGEPLPTTTGAPYYSIAQPGQHPEPLPGSGGWFGSGCAPGSSTLPDGIWWGYITDLSSTSVTFDLACIRFAGETDDDPASEDYAWVIENDNPNTRVIAVHPDTLVSCPWGGCRPYPFPYLDWMNDSEIPHGDEGGRESGLWLYINNGSVTEISDAEIAG